MGKDNFFSPVEDRTQLCYAFTAYSIAFCTGRGKGDIPSNKQAHSPQSNIYRANFSAKTNRINTISQFILLVHK